MVERGTVEQLKLYRENDSDFFFVWRNNKLLRLTNGAMKSNRTSGDSTAILTLIERTRTRDRQRCIRQS